MLEYDFFWIDVMFKDEFIYFVCEVNIVFDGNLLVKIILVVDIMFLFSVFICI